MSSNNTTTSTGCQQSKAVITVILHNSKQAVGDILQLLCSTTRAILDAEAPTKHLRKSLLKTRHYLLDLQSNIVSKLPNLIASECAHYPLTCIHTIVNTRN